MRKLKRIKSKPKKVDKTTYNPTSNRRTRLIKEWSSLEPNFTHHSVLRFKKYESDPMLLSYELKEYNYKEDYHTKVYNQKISHNYVDKVMDNLVKRKSINQAIAFVEQDDSLNNHLHFAWSCSIALTRKQIANSMRTNIRFIRDVRPIISVEDAIAYFSKRIEAKGSYYNIYV